MGWPLGAQMLGCVGVYVPWRLGVPARMGISYVGGVNLHHLSQGAALPNSACGLGGGFALCGPCWQRLDSYPNLGGVEFEGCSGGRSLLWQDLWQLTCWVICWTLALLCLAQTANYIIRIPTKKLSNKDC